ncbi:MAG: hypothetical protein ABI294_07020, partial [Casimicrobiaceae bacterium]
KQDAHALVAEIGRHAAREGRALGVALKADARVGHWLDAAAIDRLVDPANYLGMSAAFVDRVLATR